MGTSRRIKMTRYHIISLLVAFLQHYCGAADMSSVEKTPLKSFRSNILNNEYKTFTDNILNSEDKTLTDISQKGMDSSLWISNWRSRPDDLARWTLQADPIDAIHQTFLSGSKDMTFRIPRRFGKRHDDNAIDNPTKLQRKSKWQPLERSMDFDDFKSPAVAAYFPDSDSAYMQNEIRENSNMLSNSNGNYNSDVDNFTRRRKGRLGRMPMAFGKRSEPKLPSADNQNNPLSFSTATAEITQHMPEIPVDKISDRLNVADRFARVTKGRLFRMPVAFGKRKNKKGLQNEDKQFIAARSHISQVGSPYLTFLKHRQGPTEYDPFSDPLPKMPNAFVAFGEGEKLDNNDYKGHSNLFMRVSKGSLSRMPMSFGKRDYRRDNFFKKAIDYRTDKFPVTLIKRDIDNKYQAFFDILKARVHSLSPEVKDNINIKIKQLLDQLLSKGASLTRLTRSKLERMPITFGKRGNDPVHTKKRHSGIHNVMVRSALDRMPLAFGKRDPLSFKLATSLQRHQKQIIPNRPTAEPSQSRITENMFSASLVKQKSSQHSRTGSIPGNFSDGRRQSYMTSQDVQVI